MATGLAQDIDKASIRSAFQDGESFKSLSLESVARLSRLHKVSGREVEIAALESGVVPERYVRNMKTFSLQQQAVLLGSCVSVVGLGGLGGGVIEILARMGVGALNLVDGDTFEQSNLNRQLLSAEKTLAETKVAAGIGRIQAINSSVIVNTHAEFLTRENGALILGSSDVIVDCLGGLGDRFLLERTSKKTGCPLVSAAVAGLAGHVTTIFPEDPGLELIYGKQDTLPLKGAEATLGCLPQMTTLLAALQCSQVTHILLKNGTVLRNQMLAVDLQDNTFEVVMLC